MSDSNYDDYEQLCGGLEKLGTAFESALDRFGPVHHRLVHADKRVSDAGWKKFAEAHRKTATADAEQWEKWRPHPNGMACSYFFGRGSKANLDEFIRLADSGYAMLLDLARLQEKGGVPSDADIYLPERYRGSDWDLSNDYLEWLLVLHDMATGCHTIWLRDHVGFWGHPQPGTKSMEEEAHMVEEVVEMWSGTKPDSFPLHPFTESFQHDLFLSSAEAIRIWLDPNDEEIVPVGKGIEESPIYLPKADSVHEDDASLFAPVAPEPNLLAPLAAEPKSDVPLKPNWDDDRRRLRVGDKLIKVFNQEGKNQVAILQAFEKRNWPTTPIVNPLDDKQQGTAEFKILTDTVHDLNKHHRTKNVLRFHASRGTASWELTPFSGEQ